MPPRLEVPPRSAFPSRNLLLSCLRMALFVVGSAIVVFIAARNSITWHLQRFWGASGDFWQSQWDKIYTLCDGDGFTMAVYGTHCVTFFVYWLVGALYTIVDLTGKPEFVIRYKIQPDKNAPVEPTKVVQVILQVLFNQFFVGIPFSILAYHALQARGNSFSRELPTFETVVLELSVFVLAEEFGFYYSHRLLHRPGVYKYVHKKHHEWTAPIAVTAVYCHPIEHVLSNLAPIFLGPLIMGSHIATVWLWCCLALVSTLNAHCGYHLPFLPSPEAHDFHHLKFNQNFGMLGVLDRLHGTDVQFRASKAYDRHIMLLSLAPMRQLVPDTNKGKLRTD